MLEIDTLLQVAVEHKASDIHLATGMAPVFRLHGLLKPQEQFPVLTPVMLDNILKKMVNIEQQTRFWETGELDFIYSVPEIGRFRVNAFKQQGSIGVALRWIGMRIPSLAELTLPKIIEDFTHKTKGLILVTGPSGSGKSTTLAMMVDLINSEQRCHIITLEDPIEYVHQHKKSVVHQREIGSDSLSFANALRAALRQDPDVILVGEMRDLETITTAITAAETGHLVMATLHTASAAQTIDRIIDTFPAYQQRQIRIQLADCLEGIIAQQLLPRQDKLGRVAVTEVLVATPAIKNLIREGKTHQILSAIQTGGKYGMQSLDASLRKLYQEGKISREIIQARFADSKLTYEIQG